MVENALRDKGAGPAADEREQVQAWFGRPASTGARRRLVASVRDERGDARNEVEDSDSDQSLRRGLMHASIIA